MATPTSLQRLTRRALLARAKADVDLTALVPVASIAPSGEPAWPFVTIETPRTSRIRATCVRGATVRFDVHAFAGPREDAGAVVETGYDHASRIGSAIEAALGDARVTLEGGAVARLEFSDGQMLRDGAPDDWHWFAQINCRVLAEPV